MGPVEFAIKYLRFKSLEVFPMCFFLCVCTCVVANCLQNVAKTATIAFQRRRRELKKTLLKRKVKELTIYR